MKTRRVARMGLSLLAVIAALAFWSSRAPCEGELFGASPDASVARHVLVISIDGLGASWYTRPSSNLRIPYLHRLKEEGSFAEGVEGVYPSVTYPSHTTLVTGRLPAEHGVYSNLSSREPGKNVGDWFWFAKAIKVPALWDEARRHGLKTASVFWPATAGAPIDWDFPEVWDPQIGPVGDPLYVAKFATPGLLFEAALELGLPKPGTDEDTTRTRLAAFLLRSHKPNLLLVHLASLDRAEHRYGPESAEAAAALEGLDTQIGELLAAVTEAGLEGSTDVFIVSDHGFLPVERAIRPNVLLAKAGLLETDEKGRVTGGKLATVANGGSFFIYWSDSQDLQREVDAALRPLRNDGLLWGVLNRSALADLGAESEIKLALEAPSGADFDDSARGEVVATMGSPGGAHGYLPFRRGLEAAFIAWGPSIKKGVNLRCIPMTAIGPTMLKALGIDSPQFGSPPPLAEILK